MNLSSYLYYCRMPASWFMNNGFTSRVLDQVLHSVGREIGVLSPELSPMPEGGQIRLESF